jgi:hypothetical protein
VGKKVNYLLVLLALFALVFLLTPVDVHGALSSTIKVDMIDRVVVPIYGGLVLINDTIQISPTEETILEEHFSVGFAIGYKPNLRLIMAHDVGDSEPLNVIQDTGLGSIGYYGAKIVLSNVARDRLNDGQPYTFKVTYLFTDLIESSDQVVNATTKYIFTIDIPFYPTLQQEASICNVNVLLPEGAEYIESEILFNSTQQDDQVLLKLTRANLPEFTQTSMKLSFAHENQDSFTCLFVDRLNREISFDDSGFATVSEQYVVESRNRFNINKIRVRLPEGITDVASYDEQGKILSVSLSDNETNGYDISINLVENQSRSFRLTYSLLKENRVTELDSRQLMVNTSILENLRMLPRLYNLKIMFPEGAVIESFPTEVFTIQRGVFQETLTISRYNATWLQDTPLSLVYSYQIFWASFRPTLWATVLVAIGSVVAFSWKRPKAPITVTTVLVPQDTLEEFVETYEEKKKTVVELEQARKKAEKRKISRRRYKIKKTTLENKISTLSKRLTELRNQISSGGAKYEDIMRMWEVAEIELENIEADIRRIEVRFKRGEVSAKTYRRLLEDDLKRRDKARTTIEGVLLRLQE